MRPELVVRNGPCEGGRLAKRLPLVQQGDASFPGHCVPVRNGKKPPDSSGFAYLSGGPARRSEPLATAPALPAVAGKPLAVEAAAIRAVVAVHHAVAPATETPLHAGKGGK